MTRNPNVYPSPEEFKPERFLDSAQKGGRNPDPKGFMFGFGRR